MGVFLSPLFVFSALKVHCHFTLPGFLYFHHRLSYFLSQPNYIIKPWLIQRASLSHLIAKEISARMIRAFEGVVSVVRFEVVVDNLLTTPQQLCVFYSESIRWQRLLFKGLSISDSSPQFVANSTRHELNILRKKTWQRPRLF